MDSGLVLELIVEEPTLYLCGAGISVPGEFKLPAASDFLECLRSVLNTYIDDLALVSSAIWGETGQAPLRFERIVSVMAEVDPSMSFLGFLKLPHDDSRQSCANRFHAFLADQILKRKVVLTTNFDALIETAVQRQEPFYHYAWLRKIHGSIQVALGNDLYDAEASRLRTTIRSVSEGMDFWELSGFQKSIQEACDGSRLAIIGYSVSDGYDITPALQKARPKQVTFFQYGAGVPTTTHIVSDLALAPRRLLEEWQSHGTNVVVVKGDVYPHLPEVRVVSPQTAFNAPDLASWLGAFVSSREVAEFILARLFYFQDDYVEASKLFDRLSTSANHRFRSFALTERARSAPEWNESLAAAEEALGKIIELEEQIRIRLIMLDALANLGPIPRFRRAWKDYRHLMQMRSGPYFKDTLEFGRSLHSLAQSLVYAGRFAMATIVAHQSYRLRKAGGDSFDAHNAISLLGTCAAFRRDLSECDRILDIHRLYTAENNDEIAFREQGYLEAQAQYLRGEFAQSARTLEGLSPTLGIDPTLHSDPDLCCLLASCLWRLEAQPRVQEVALKGLDYAREHGFSFHIPIFEGLLEELPNADLGKRDAFAQWHLGPL